LVTRDRARANEVARLLLETGAISIRPDRFYEFSSGLKSPLYTDNRRLMSYPTARRAVTDGLEALLRHEFPKARSLAGVATAGIPWAAWLAERTGLPLVYVRASAKERGLEKQIEGDPGQCDDVLVLEDLVTTGLSSAHAVRTLREADIAVEGLMSIFSYDLPFAERLMLRDRTRFASVVGLDELLEAARSQLTEDQLAAIDNWRAGLISFEPAHQPGAGAPA
jgi:orotate phosphoribosyltransferase